MPDPEAPGGAVVIGVGNPFRGDDGVGWLVVDLVEARLGPGTRAVRLDGEAARLIEAWRGADLAVVVDAEHASPARAAVRVLEVTEARAGHGTAPTAGPELPAYGAPPSSHAVGVADAVNLARALDLLPERLVVVAVAGESFDQGEGLSPRAAEAATEAAVRVLELIAPCTHP